MKTLNGRQIENDCLKDSVRYLAQDFSVELLFDRKTDELYGFRYKSGYKDADAAVKDFGEIISQLTEEYGSPDTYPGLQNRYTDAQEAAKELEQKESLVESWNIDEQKIFVLNAVVQKTEGTDVVIWLTYQLQDIPAGGRGSGT